MGDPLPHTMPPSRRDRGRPLECSEIDVESVDAIAEPTPLRGKDDEKRMGRGGTREKTFGEDTSDPVRMYLPRMGACSLPHAEQEVEIAEADLKPATRDVRTEVLALALLF